MTFTFQTGSYNVTSSINKWIKDNLNADLPAWTTGAFAINWDYPDVPLFNEAAGDFAPKFSVAHLGNYELDGTESYLLDSGHKGQTVAGVMEVCAWVNLKASATTYNADWKRNLTQMRDMVVKLFSATRYIQIVDVYASSTAPQSTGYIVRIRDVDEIDVPTIEANPNVRRRRLLINYYWSQRST